MHTHNTHTHTHTHMDRVKGVLSPFECGTITSVVSMATCGAWEGGKVGEL